MPKSKKRQSNRKKNPDRGPLRRAGCAILVVVCVLVAVPLVLVPIYAVVPPPFSTLELWVRLTGGTVERQWVRLDDIAPVLAFTVITSEDDRFCEHGGVDWVAVRKVIESESSRGASTIPMQVAKNLFLWQSRSYVRKALEVPLAYWIDLIWTKRRIIEVYLNIVEWGPGVFGAEAAARHWFKVPASKLTARQAALLAAALPNPIERNPARPDRTTGHIASSVEKRARKSGAYVQCILKD